MWDLTVLMEMYISLAISVVSKFSRRATCWSTSRSRSVSGSIASVVGCSGRVGGAGGLGGAWGRCEQALVGVGQHGVTS
jgi:hypothetical protein